MAHAGKKLALRPVCSLRLFLRGMQLALGAFAIGGIANCRHRQDTLIGFERAKPDLDRKLLSILARSSQLQPGAHGAAAWIFEKVAPIPGMLPAETLRHQNLDLSSEQFLALVTKDFFCLRIHQHDRSLAVDNDNGIGSGFEQRFEFLICLDAFGNVLRRSNDPDDLAGIVLDGTGQGMQKPGLAARQNNAGLDSGGFIAPDQFLQPFAHPLPVLLVNGGHETIVAGEKFVRCEPK